MRQRPVRSPPLEEPPQSDDRPNSGRQPERAAGRSSFLWISLCILLLNGSWAVYHLQYERLPLPLTAEQAGKRGFSEELAMEHVKALTSFGPHPVGSDALDLAVKYVLDASETIKKTAHWEVDVQVGLFHAKSGSNRLTSGLFKGKTLLYSDLKHVVLRIVPKYLPEAEEDAILISSHIDTVFSTEGAGDCSSCIAVMLELARGISQWAHGFKTGVIFLFNTGEEEGLNGAHSFITQHPWRQTIRFFVDLEAMGIGGKSSIFQSGSASWAVETFARVAKYPSGQMISQDIFHSGAIKSATDFQVYDEVGGLPGLDFAFMDATAVYHTKNDKLTSLKPGSLQDLGDNMLAFLLQIAMSSKQPPENAAEGTHQEQAIFFDILGSYMVVYRQRFASMLQNSVIIQAILIWTASLVMGGYPAFMAAGLSLLTIVLMWLFSLSLSVPVAFLLPYICTHPVPYLANPWLVVGLFVAPAIIGAIAGQHIGYLMLLKYLRLASRKKVDSTVSQFNTTKFEAERWLFKAGFIQWLVILILGNTFRVGSSYIALVWLVSPAFAYGLIEATLTPARSPKQLRIMTLLLGVVVPVLISGGLIIRLTGVLTGSAVRFDRNPGSTPVWLGNIVMAIYISGVVCLMLVYLLSYLHLSGAKKMVVTALCTLFGLSLAAVSSGLIPVFTNDISRAVNVVHIVDATDNYPNYQNPVSYVSLFSTTPGKLTKEVENLNDEEFSCGKDQKIDLVTFTVNYGCLSLKNTADGWAKSDIPIFKVLSDSVADVRKTEILVDTKLSTRWSLAINSEQVSHFSIGEYSDSSPSVDEKSDADGDDWHIIQYSGGKNSPTKFRLTIFWAHNTSDSTGTTVKQGTSLLLKLRTDVNRITPVGARVLKNLPSWCSLFGKSTSPYTLAFLAALPIKF